MIIPPSQFSKDMAEVVNNKSFADMIIEVQNKEGISTHIYAHKAILFTRSDYFRVILNPNSAFSERGKSSFKFPEITQVTNDFFDHQLLFSCVQFSNVHFFFFQETLLELIRFLYTNTVPQLDEDNVVDLLMGADRFLIDDLKSVHFFLSHSKSVLD